MREPSKYNNRNFDVALPAVCLEIIADQVNSDRKMADELCARLRRHWFTSQTFRNSFKRKDPRDVCLMWMKHWHAGNVSRQRRTATPA